MPHNEMNMNKIEQVVLSITNGQRAQARAQIRAYGVRQFFRDLYDLDYISAEFFQDTWMLFNNEY